MQKRRSDIAKLVSHSREVWRQSLNYQEAKRRCRIAGKPGWFDCQLCDNEVEVIRIDHIQPIGKQPVEIIQFGGWLDKLFCDASNLQGLCNACHKQKTKEERKRARAN